MGFTLEVAATGRVSACQVTDSSGSAALDEATCRIARERAQFEPALDRRGRPVPDRVASRVHWVLPATGMSNRAQANLASYVSSDDYPAEAIRAGEQGIVGFELDIGPDGSVSACRVELSSNSASLDETTCRLLTSRARFRPAVDPSGRAVADRVRGRIRWVLPAEDPEPASNEVDLTSYFSSADYPREAIRQRVEGQVRVRLSVALDGRVTQCLVTQSSGSVPLDARTCAIIRARARFSMIRNAALPTEPAVMDGFVRWALPSS